MRQNDLLTLLRQVPCPRIRLYLIGGKTFELLDPDLVVVARPPTELLIPDEPDREAVVILLHVIWAEVVSPRD